MSTPRSNATEPGKRSGVRSLPRSLRDEIHAMIIDEGLKAGDRMPSESEVMKSFSVGRTTVREAYQLLEQDGIVESQQGRGRFVTMRPALVRPLTVLEGVTEMMASRGFPLDNEVLDVRLDEPTAEERASLRLAAGDTVIRLDRLRTHGDDAVVYSQDVFNRALVDRRISEVDWTGSLFQLLADEGHEISFAVAEVSAVILDEALGDRIGQEPGLAWLLLAQEHTGSGGTPILLSRDYHRGTDFSFVVQRLRPR